MNAEEFNRCLRSLRTDERAFRSIYEYYLPRIKHHLFARFGGQVDFEDVAHDAFAKLFGINDPPPVTNPTAYIYRICDNIALDEIKKRGKTLPLDENVSARTEENSEFFSLLHSLGGEDEEIVELVIWEGYNLKEAAAVLGISHAAARQRYSRALKKLKEILKDDKKKT